MIPMDSMDLSSVPINSPNIEKLDTVKTKSERPQDSTGSKLLTQSPSGGDVQVRVPARSLILGQLWKKVLSPINRILKKRGMPTQNNSESLVHINVRRKPKPTVKDSTPPGLHSL